MKTENAIPNRSKRQREWHEIQKFCTDNPTHYLRQAMDARQMLFDIGFSCRNVDAITAEIRRVYRQLTVNQ